jgi:hypothetical protein
VHSEHWSSWRELFFRNGISRKPCKRHLFASIRVHSCPFAVVRMGFSLSTRRGLVLVAMSACFQDTAGAPLTAAILLRRNINGIGHKVSAVYVDRVQRCDVGRLWRQASELNTGAFSDVESKRRRILLDDLD